MFELPCGILDDQQRIVRPDVSQDGLERDVSTSTHNLDVLGEERRVLVEAKCRVRVMAHDERRKGCCGLTQMGSVH